MEKEREFLYGMYNADVVDRAIQSTNSFYPRHETKSNIRLFDLYKEQPDGYEKSTECIDFSVDGTKITSVVMENAHIPNTSAFRKTTIYIIGGILMLLGIGSFGYVMYKKKGRN